MKGTDHDAKTVYKKLAITSSDGATLIICLDEDGYATVALHNGGEGPEYSVTLSAGERTEVGAFLCKPLVY
jgi:hypothetical protein